MSCIGPNCLFGFLIFQLWEYLMRIVPETLNLISTYLLPFRNTSSVLTFFCCFISLWLCVVLLRSCVRHQHHLTCIETCKQPTKLIFIYMYSILFPYIEEKKCFVINHTCMFFYIRFYLVILTTQSNIKQYQKMSGKQQQT